MKIISHLPGTKPTSYQLFHRLVVTLILVLGLLLGAANSRAASYTFTNTTGSAFNDPNAWNPVTGPPGLNDTASYTLTGTYDLPLTNNYISNIGTLLFGSAAGGQTLIVTLDFGTNIFAAISGNTSSASGFVFGQQGTSIVYATCGQILCTNSGNNARFMVGRNGPATFILTNGFVAGGNLVIANGTGANGSKVVVSGPNSTWSNASTIAVGNGGGSAFNSLVISNSGSMVALSTIQLGNSGYFNSLLLDSSGSLFIKNVGSLGSSTGSSNNTATVQGGGLWNLGGQKLFIGNATGQGNSLIVGGNGTVSNTTFVILAGAGNSLVMSGGVLTVSGGITNTSGIISGFGTIASGVAFASGGTLSGGYGTTVGTLTVSNGLTLASGSTTVLKLDNSQTTSNDQINVVGTLADAGTLTVITNGVAALNIGDQYQLFVGTQAGTFTTVNLPQLDPSKLWDTSQLASAGILAVTFRPVVPGMIGPTNQVVHEFGDTISISATVTGVPVPGVYWQFNGSSIVDGPTGNGGTFSGTATSSLTIQNAQSADSGNYCLVATNSAGVATNCMALTVSTNPVPPSISGMMDQTVIQGNNGSFNASVAGFPQPTVKWQQNGVDIPGATDVPLILTNVQYSQDGFVYTLIADNIAGSATNSATLHVIITPAIQTQPVSLVVTTTQSACFSVVSTNGIPAPTYQWFFNNHAINFATNSTYCIASAVPANDGAYNVQVCNAAGCVTSSNATLTVDSAMTATLSPVNGAVNWCYDTPLFITFSQTPALSGAGKISIYDSTNSTTPVDTIDTSLGAVQARTIGTEVFNAYPVIINGSTVQIYPDHGVLSSNQTYYVTVDPNTIMDTNGAFFAGITTTNGWVFTTKPMGPANPNNVVVAADGSGDFCTCQGALDSLPANNTTYTLISVRNGLYTEIVDTKTKNNVTFRGQERTMTMVGYPNNNTLNGSTATRPSFKINANDNAVENMTVTNMTPKGGSQAEAIMVNTGAARFILNNAVVSSYQDTILINDVSSQAYFYKSLIKGDTDFIWGVGVLFATNCEIRTVTGSASITQPRTTAGSNGLDFVDCQLTRTGTNVTSTTFARALGFCDGNAAFINCQIDSNVVGWTASDLSGCPNLRWWEYGNTDLLTGSNVTYNGTILTNGDSRLACALSPTCWLNGWVPQLAPNILTNPVSMTVTAGTMASFNVAATGVPDPSYQWLLNGTNVINATANNATLVISNALLGDAGVYSVIVSNGASVVNSGTATLTVVGTAPTANFTASPTSGAAPLAVTFTDTSSGSPN
ncbi:MAG TPA: pectinesterase family protein, partial [Verrucomicrobiae bacterium]|nr:pectinesterase family protein [Verrucomicrobiae bacterium]